MRDGSRGSRTTSAFATIAVVGQGAGLNGAITHFAKQGFIVGHDPFLERLMRNDGASVLHLVRGSEDHLMDLVRESYEMLDEMRAGSATTRLTFQPAWSVFPDLQPLGYELLVVDDDDATHQLDALYSALEGTPVMGSRRRSHITICPRGGWEGYGHPDVRGRG